MLLLTDSFLSIPLPSLPLHTHKHAQGYGNNCDVLEVELGQSPKLMVRGWNTHTHHWLKDSVHSRVRIGKRPNLYNAMVTYLASACWHGFYAGYFFAFIGGAVIDNVGKTGRKKVRGYFTGRGRAVKLFYDCLTWVVAQSVLNHVFLAFQVLTIDNVWRFHRYDDYFVPHMLAVAALFVLPLLPNAYDVEEEARKAARKAKQAKTDAKKAE